MARETAGFTAGVALELEKAKLSAFRAVRQAGEEAARTAKSLAPRESGAMADSIEAQHGRDSQGPYSDVVVEPFYATFIEFGREGVPAQPFIRPGVASALKHLRRSR